MEIISHLLFLKVIIVLKSLPRRDFGPVVSVTKFKDEANALEIANDTLYGLGAGVWTRNGNIAYRMGRGIQAGIVWTTVTMLIQLTHHLWL